jgi:hypothetical protein
MFTEEFPVKIGKDLNTYSCGGIPRSRQIFLARKSLISVCLGMLEVAPDFGLK